MYPDFLPAESDTVEDGFFAALTDEDVLTFAEASIEFARECEEAHYDGHADDMLDPLHGTDMDPCAICQPTIEFDQIVATVHDPARHQYGPLLADAA